MQLHFTYLCEQGVLAETLAETVQHCSCVFHVAVFSGPQILPGSFLKTQKVAALQLTAASAIAPHQLLNRVS